MKGFFKHNHISYLIDIKYSRLQGFADMKAQTCKQAGINNQIARLRRFLKFCVNHDWIVKNEADKWESLKTTTPIRYSFTEPEMEPIWKNMDPRFLPYYKLMNETGLRACDMWDLTKDDFKTGKSELSCIYSKAKLISGLEYPFKEG